MIHRCTRREVYHLIILLKQNNVDGTVLVQVNQSMEENEFMLSLAKENDFIKGIVEWVDLQAENILEQLDILQQHKKLKGFRHIIQAKKDLGIEYNPLEEYRR